MKNKFVLILLFLAVTATIHAVDIYPSYRGSGRVVYVPVAVENISQYRSEKQHESINPFEASHCHALGEELEPVVSEPGATAPTAGSGPRRSPTEPGVNTGDTHVDGDGTWMWVDGVGWVKLSDDGISQGDANDDRLPIGSPVLPFLLFALLACGVIYYRRSKLARA